jgi:phosphoribosylamine--glycine ligase
MIGGSLGAAGAELVIEDCLVGEEASFFAICDGDHAVAFGTAQDHKRVHDGDTGPNTGGMGAYSPAPVLTPELQADVMERIIRPTLAAMRGRGTPFVGVLYAGLMLTAEGPQLIEYNVRFGDPETQVLMPRLRTDLVAVMLAACSRTLEQVEPSWSDEAALTVVMAAEGYPGGVQKGSAIRGTERAAAREGVTVFHAGTQQDGDTLVAAGGRVLNVTATGASIGEARDRAYAAIAEIDWPEGFCRSDIGWRAIAHEASA